MFYFDRVSENSLNGGGDFFAACFDCPAVAVGPGPERGNDFARPTKATVFHT